MGNIDELSWSEKIIRSCRDEFVERVNPRDLLPYLGDLLTTANERKIRARQDFDGSNAAALVLLDCFLKCENWLPQLLIALRNPEINMPDLAEKFEQQAIRIEAHVTIPKVSTSQGPVCLDSHHCDMEIDEDMEIESEVVPMETEI
ncbi:hypothetical protein ScPMuIL_016012 [Solemya velum]